ncbi:MAG: acyltransferase [Sphingobacteriales bacterium]|nr:MAG: acyltransferase [Sphingobacteriales bacterium]
MISHFTFLHSFSPYWINSVVPGGWSVSIEVLFYLLLPFLFFRINTLGKAINLVLFAVVLRILFVLLLRHLTLVPDQQLWGDFLFMFLPNQLQIFAIGIVMYFVLFAKEKGDLSHKSILIIAILLLTELATGSGIILPAIFFWALGFCLLIAGLHKYQLRSSLFVPVIYIGEISYSMYLSHFAVLFAMDRYSFYDLFPGSSPYINFFTNFLLLFGITILTSTVLHYLIDKPFQQLGKKIASMRMFELRKT